MARSRKTKSSGSDVGEATPSPSFENLSLPFEPSGQSLAPNYLKHRRAPERRLRRASTRAHLPIWQQHRPRPGVYFAAANGWTGRCDSCDASCTKRTLTNAVLRERFRVELSQPLRLCPTCRSASKKYTVETYVPEQYRARFLRFIDNLEDVPLRYDWEWLEKKLLAQVR
jgi:hypothetical protein